MRKFSRAYGHLASCLSATLLLLGTGAFGQASGDEAERWLKALQDQGGLTSPNTGTPKKNVHKIPHGNAEKLDAFRNAYYFYYAMPGGGGLRNSQADSLELAADQIDGAAPVRTFQKYQTVFFDKFPDKFAELTAKGKKFEDAFDDAMEFANQKATNVVLSSDWEAKWKAEPSTNVEKEVRDWAMRSKAIFGGGLDPAKADELAEAAAKAATGLAQGLDRMATHPAVAVRSLFWMASATHQGGGLGYGDAPDKAIAFVKEFLKHDNAVVRAELFRNSFHRHILDPMKAEDAKALAMREAFDATVERDVNSGEVKVTPASGVSAK